MGWHSLTPVLRPLFPMCHSVPVVCPPLSGDGDGHAITHWLPLAVPRPGCPVPPGHAVPHCPGPPGAGGHRGTEVAICRFCCTGTARVWHSPLGIGPSGMCPDPAQVTEHCPPATQPLAFGGMSPWQVFQGTGQTAQSHLDRAAPALPCPHCPWARMSLLPSLWGQKCWPRAQNPL